MEVGFVEGVHVIQLGDGFAINGADLAEPLRWPGFLLLGLKKLTKLMIVTVTMTAQSQV
jgi:hypothetical protein